MRILFCGDSPTVNTGFGIVARNLLLRLHKMGHEIVVLGINHFGDPYNPKEFPFPIYPVDRGNIEAMYGYNKFWPIYEAVKPDIVFFLNDPWIINEYLIRKPANVKMAKTVAYYPTDAGPIKKGWMDMLNSLDAQVCYSHFAESVILESNGGKLPKNLHQVYHGVDTKTYFPLNQQMARAALGIPTDKFVIGMVARNQYRKRFDILLKAFQLFSKGKPEAMLYLHTAKIDVGWDIDEMVGQLGLKDRVYLTEGVRPDKGVSDAELNMIYNSWDISTLISLGDGFGLPVAESMATGCPQLVSDHSCLKELVDGHGGLTAKTSAWLMNVSGINTWGGVTDVDDLVEKMEILYNNRDMRIKLAEQGYAFINQEKFTWDYAANEFNSIFKTLLHIL
jgi:glycosyltransferase involved in cell wall biosynthesis